MDSTSWLVAALILIAGEMLFGGATQLILLLLGLGCIAAGIAAYFTPSTSIQVLVFALTSFIAIMGVKPVLKKHTEQKTIPTNVDRYIGQEGIALSKITRTGGKILVLDNKWRAITEAGEVEEGEDVRVLRVDGTKMIVEGI
ncbi:hypothetical protein BEH94_02445 [Candidatus Altiarchaeales archaeon WOR_SM1_SCG]|nr:hypothetical protein BEH94_02445 [Candidatus Altiarchaeales archaeon WOR_SM1_SCG]